MADAELQPSLATTVKAYISMELHRPHLWSLFSHVAMVLRSNEWYVLCSWESIDYTRQMGSIYGCVIAFCFIRNTTIEFVCCYYELYLQPTVFSISLKCNVSSKRILVHIIIGQLVNIFTIMQCEIVHFWQKENNE